MAIATEDAIEQAVLKARRRITVRESQIMADSGALGPEPRRYELIKGVIVERMPEGPVHQQSCLLTEDFLHRVVPAGFFVSMGHPLVDEPDDTAPIPDAMVIRGRIRDFAGAYISPAFAALVIEISHTSLSRDQGWKKDLYAEMGVPIYWIVNLVGLTLEIYRNPATPAGGGPARYQVAEKPKTGRAKARLILDKTLIHEFYVREILP